MQCLLETLLCMMLINISLKVTSRIVFSYEAKVIIKYLWIKYKYDAARIVNYHPEYDGHN